MVGGAGVGLSTAAVLTAKCHDSAVRVWRDTLLQAGACNC